jgi:MFS family permease
MNTTAETKNSATTWTAGTLKYSSAGLALLFFWLLFGDFAFMLRERSAAPTAQLMLKEYQASDFATGIFLLTIPQAIIFFLGPMISYWSDRHRGRWGRRIPFLLWPTPITALSMIGLGYSPFIGKAMHEWMGRSPGTEHLSVLMVMVFFWTIFEIGVVISNSVFNGLINDVVPRAWLGRFYGMFRAVGLAVGVLFNYQIIGHVEGNFALVFTCIGLIYGVGFTIMCLKVKEGDYPPPPEREPGKSLFRIAITDYYRDCLSRPYYLWVFCFIALGTVTYLPVNTFAIFAAKSYGMSMDLYGKYMVATFTFSFLLAVPIGWLVDRFHPIRVAQVALVLYGSLMLVAFFLLRDQASFGVALLVHGVVSGIYWTGTAAIGQMLYPQMKFAQFGAAGGLITAGFSMCMGPVLGLLLDGLGNDYRYTFLAGSVLAFASVGLGWVVYRKWQQHGGQHNYVAPT